MRTLPSNSRHASGFSLVEMLVTCLILTLFGGLATQAVNTAAIQFGKQTQRSEAQLLCTEISTFLEDELTCASDVLYNADGSLVSYRSRAHSGGQGSYIAASSAETDSTFVGATASGSGSQPVLKGNGLTAPYPVAPAAMYRTSANDMGVSEMCASIGIAWDTTNKVYQVQVKVFDKDSLDQLAASSFTVRPAVEPSPDSSGP